MCNRNKSDILTYPFTFDNEQTMSILFSQVYLDTSLEISEIEKILQQIFAKTDAHLFEGNQLRKIFNTWHKAIKNQFSKGNKGITSLLAIWSLIFTECLQTYHSKRWTLVLGHHFARLFVSQSYLPHVDQSGNNQLRSPSENLSTWQLLRDPFWKCRVSWTHHILEVNTQY